MQAKILLAPASVKHFVEITSRCDFDIDIGGNNRYIVDAKSILGILGLDLTHPLTITYNGYNSELESFIRSNSMAC